MKESIPVNETFNPEEKNVPARKARRHRYSTAVRGIVIAAVSLMAAIALVLIGGGAWAWNLLGKIQYVDPAEDPEYSYSPGDFEDEIDPSAPPDTSVPTPEETAKVLQELADISLKGDTNDITNILLIGIDGDTYKSYRSDSTIIFSINNKAKTVKLVSLMRDTQVLIPGFDVDGDGRDDYAKLNTAIRSGVDRLFRTIETNFRLKIDKFVAVNFTAFPIVVDKLGGVDIELTANEAGQVPAPGTKITAETYDPNFQPLSDQGGSFHLDGFQTLQYARIRHEKRHVGGSDFSRVQRQQKVVNLLLDKVKKTNFLSLASMLSDVFPQVSTNMSQNQLLMDYAWNVGTYATYEVKTSYRIPQNGMYTNTYLRGSQVLGLTDQRACVEQLHEYLYS